MNCVLHYLEDVHDIPILESNYDLLCPMFDKQYVMSFIPNAIPNRQFEQLFYKKIDFLDDTHKEYSKYFMLYQINRYVQSKNHRRILFISSNTKLKSTDQLPDLINNINAFGPDLIKFELNGKRYEDMFMFRISVLDNNLDYANCRYEDYLNRAVYSGYEVYINSPFSLTRNLEEFV
jgi:hypothetical protein